jgi:hypothetical protein
MVKKLILVALIITYSSVINAQPLTRVDRLPIHYLKQRFFPSLFKGVILKRFYKIQYATSPVKKIGLVNDFLEGAENVDTLKLIEELLRFKGDKRLCAIPISCYGYFEYTFYYYQFGKYCHLEVEALFIIHRLFLPKPLNYSPLPVLVRTRRDKVFTEKEKIDKAYAFYQKWFTDLKKIGLARVKELPLLEYTDVEWLR